MVTEQVTAAKLRDFVEDATITDISWSEVDSSIPRFAFVSDTAFSMGPEGSIWFDSVTRALMGQSRWGPVAVWKPNGMETRRLGSNIDGSGTIAPGVCVGLDSDGDPTAGDASAPAFEIAPGTNTANLGDQVIGMPLHDTSVTNGEHPRIQIWGMTQMRIDDFNVNNDVGSYGGSADAAGIFTRAAAENTDEVCGVILGRASSDEYGVSQTAFIYLFPPLWRA
jgi:hypothetical protein